MVEKEIVDLRLAHEQLSKSCFNAAWDLIEKRGRSPGETNEMIHLAHASVYHWMKRADCTDQNLSIGYWQLARVYALAGMPESALHFAKYCLAYSEKHGVAPVFLGYAHEALARAYQAGGDAEQVKMNLEKVREIAITLPDDDREQLLADIEDIS